MHYICDNLSHCYHCLLELLRAQEFMTSETVSCRCFIDSSSAGVTSSACSLPGSCETLEHPVDAASRQSLFHEALVSKPSQQFGDVEPLPRLSQTTMLPPHTPCHTLRQADYTLGTLAIQMLASDRGLDAHPDIVPSRRGAAKELFYAC